MAKAAVAVGLMLVAAAGTMYSQYQAGKENQKIHKLNAEMANNAAKLQADRTFEDGARRLSAISADAGASGFTQDGSVLDTLFEQARQTERDAQVSIYNGQIQATSELAQGVQAMNNAKRSMFQTAMQTGSKAASMGMGGGMGGSGGAF
jgi:hypothetical protein